MGSSASPRRVSSGMRVAPPMLLASRGRGTSSRHPAATEIERHPANLHTSCWVRWTDHLWITPRLVTPNRPTPGGWLWARPRARGGGSAAPRALGVPASGAPMLPDRGLVPSPQPTAVRRDNLATNFYALGRLLRFPSQHPLPITVDEQPVGRYPESPGCLAWRPARATSGRRVSHGPGCRRLRPVVSFSTTGTVGRGGCGSRR